MLIRVKYPHPYCKANILSYCSVNINIGIGIGQMCFDISVSDRIGYLPYRWITSVFVPIAPPGLRVRFCTFAARHFFMHSFPHKETLCNYCMHTI